MKIEVNKLNSNPFNRKVYGFDENINDLAAKIKESKWIKPIIINSNNMIISGHRRIEACKALGIESVEFEYAPDDPLTQMELFLNENQYREKTTYQKAREAEIYMDIEKKKAYNRMMHVNEPVETIPQGDYGEDKGRTRDIVGKKVGLSGKSLDKSQEVLEKIDSTYEETFVDFFKDTLNENIDAASKLVNKSNEEIQTIYEMTKGDSKLVSGVLRDKRHMEVQENTLLPPGKYQILLLDLTKRVHISMLNTDISAICEDNCILLTWALPHQVEIGIKLAKNWGFRYASCLVWNRNKEHELSDFGELCLISAKGSPDLIFQHYTGATEKPDTLKEVIELGYRGWSRAEIFKEGGWQIW
jgi:hypothetical protein